MKKKNSIAVVCFYEATSGGHGAAEVTLSVFESLKKYKKKIFEIKKKNIFKILEKYDINFLENFYKLFKIFFLIVDIKNFLKESENPIIIIEGASWIGYSYLTIKLCKYFLPKSYIIYHSHNIEFILRKKKNNIIISLISKVLEKKVYQISTIATAVSTIDQKILKELYNVKSVIFSNGINKKRLIIKKIKRNMPKKYFIYFGSYSFFPNKEAIDYIINNIMPQMRIEHPDIKLVIVGKDLPLKILQDNKEIYFFKNLKKEYLNFLISKAKFLLAPMFKATGTKLKIIETLMLGSVIICSKHAVNGIELNNKINPPFIYKNKKEMFRMINYVLNKNYFLKQKAKKYSNFFVNRYCMENITKKLFKNI